MKTVKDLSIDDTIYTIIYGELKEKRVTKLEDRNNRCNIYIQIDGGYGEDFCVSKEASIINGINYTYYLNKIDAYNDYITEIEKIIKSDSDEIVRLVYKIRQNEQLLKVIKDSVEQYSIKQS